MPAGGARLGQGPAPRGSRWDWRRRRTHTSKGTEGKRDDGTTTTASQRRNRVREPLSGLHPPAPPPGTQEAGGGAWAEEPASGGGGGGAGAELITAASASSLTTTTGTRTAPPNPQGEGSRSWGTRPRGMPQTCVHTHTRIHTCAHTQQRGRWLRRLSIPPAAHSTCLSSGWSGPHNRPPAGGPGRTQPDRTQNGE